VHEATFATFFGHVFSTFITLTAVIVCAPCVRTSASSKNSLIHLDSRIA
jgi:hypothetical protein